MTLKRSIYHRCSYYSLIFIISHLWSGIDSQSTSGYSINVPHRVTVQRGLCVYIPCRFTVPGNETLTTDAKGLWYNKNEIIVATNKKRSKEFLIYKRFSLVGDVWRGDCTLYIEDTLHEDEGHYRFRVEDNVRYGYRDNLPYVEVTDLTDKPEISPMKSWLDGEEVTLNCTFSAICKTINPQITWEGNIQNTRGDNQVTNHENGTKTYLSTITFTARKELNNSPLSCIVRLSEGLTTAQQMTIKVEWSMDYQVIVGIVIGNIVILLLIAFGVFWFMKRHMKKKQGNNDMHELCDAKGPESIYQNLQRPTDSIYNTITGSQQ